MDMNHLIGQRFNLISKSDIRYVGTLHEINPEASTIALQDVVSFGTEGRRGNPAEEIAPSNSIYEYIVFRGSDVKDISVAEDKKENTQPEPPQVPDDPAILGCISSGTWSSKPPSAAASAAAANPATTGTSSYTSWLSSATSVPRLLPALWTTLWWAPFPPGPGFPNMPYGAPPGWYPPPGQGFPPGPGQFPPQMPIGHPGQHQTPPPQRAGPPGMPQATSELPVSDHPVSKPVSPEITPAPAATEAAPPPPVASKPSVAEAVKATTGSMEPAGQKFSKTPPSGPKGGRAPPVIPIAAAAKPPVPNVPLAPTSVNNVTQGTAQAAITEATRAATAAVAAAMAKLPQPSGQKKAQYPDSSVEGVAKQMGEMKPYESNRGPRGGQHPRGRGAHRGQYQGPMKKVEVPTTDYDFETANAKFNKQDLVKEAIATGSPAHDIEAPAEIAAPETADTGSANAYNKANSFFDNISSEARDREEGTGARTGGREWRGEEEKRNIETFGQGSVDGYRGGYRGRGRGRGYNRGRGGYSRGYGSRGRGGVRGGRTMSQSTGVPTPN
ncbi:hypothetical protein AOCH_005012 [Aspergillus ochraceoroseus]|uniref:G2/M phase checkpoint control protein n=1 Tax=Aspergillus ochraceoroseus TaxID=138278 RepID=A0A0F8W9Q4_9EURO|nr:hypothetical protein AOCH_005012 [Aspergillus ochraceoroseus]